MAMMDFQSNKLFQADCAMASFSAQLNEFVEELREKREKEMTGKGTGCLTHPRRGKSDGTA